MERICRILIVEDQGDVADLLAEFFSDEGYRIAAAATVAAMDEALRHEEFDVAIVDMTLPGGESGWTAAERLRSCNVGVILVTGDHEQMARLEASGAHHLIKPFRLHALLALVEQVLQEMQAVCAPEKHRGAL
jgi:DNA-binding response OmpR family regulator